MIASKGKVNEQSYRFCERCTFRETRTKRKCKRVTCKYGPYCWQHYRMVYNVTVKESPIGGLGLFAQKRLHEGWKIPYGGARYPEITFDIAMGRPDVVITYGIQALPDSVIDACRTNDPVGRYVNDPAGTGKQANAEFHVLGNNAYIRTTRVIEPGEEILADYGPLHHFENVPPLTEQQMEAHRSLCGGRYKTIHERSRVDNRLWFNGRKNPNPNQVLP